MIDEFGFSDYPTYKRSDRKPDLPNTKENEMKRNALNETKANETATLFELNEAASNVLDFSTTLKELRKTVDPNLVRQRAGRHGLGQLRPGQRG